MRSLSRPPPRTDRLYVYYSVAHVEYIITSMRRCMTGHKLSRVSGKGGPLLYGNTMCILSPFHGGKPRLSSTSAMREGRTQVRITQSNSPHAFNLRIRMADV